MALRRFPTGLGILAAASLSSTGASARDASISQAFNGGRITVTASSRFGGAISSLTFRGAEYVDVADHGREIQSNIQVDGLGECYNPNEAGSEADQAAATSSSSLESISSAGNVLTTSTRPAFWLAPGQRYGRHCSPSTALAAAQNRQVLSNYRISRRTSFYGPSIPNLIKADTTFTVPEEHQSASIEALTGYLPVSFDVFLQYDRASRTLRKLHATSADQRTTQPVIVSQPNGRNAVGVISPGITGADPGNAYFAYVIFGGGTPTSKWSCVYGHGHIPAGARLTYTCLMAVGTVDEVISALNAYPMPAQSVTSAVPVFRFYGHGQHDFTTSYVDASARGYAFEATAFHLFPHAGAGLQPLYRCINPSTGDHFVSRQSKCEGQHAEGLLGYSAASMRNKLLPLYRFYRASTADHLITVDRREGAANGYTLEGTLGYVLD